MELWLWVSVGIMAAVVVLLSVKLISVRRAAREIGAALADRLTTGTNTLIDISSGDRRMRDLANSLNAQLRMLRDERHRFEEGDLELKNAVTNISHDLRTPLTAICGYLDLLEAEGMSERARGYVGVIRNRAELMTGLTEELFRYSVIVSDVRARARESVDVGAALEDGIAAFYTQFNERGIAPNVRLPDKRVVRTVDGSALTRVFSNILGNAAKYSDGDLEITLYDTGTVIFSNSASKLDEVQAGRLFDRFYTVEAARRSTGLGLSIARALMERMDGSISAELKNGRLSVTVELPGEL